MGINMGVIDGRLGKDPERRQAGSGAIWTSSIAHSEWKPGVGGGQGEEKTSWFDIEGWESRNGDSPFPQDAVKGSLVQVAFSLKEENWTDKNGDKKKSVKLVIKSIGLLPARGGRGDSRGGGRDDRGRDDRGRDDRGRDDGRGRGDRDSGRDSGRRDDSRDNRSNDRDGGFSRGGEFGSRDEGRRADSRNDRPPSGGSGRDPGPSGPPGGFLDESDIPF